MKLPFMTRFAFVLAVVAEIVVLTVAVQVIGGWFTFWLVLATAFLGGWVIRKEGMRAWSTVNEALRTGQAPAEMASSQAAIAGGFLLIVPGFITDLLGILLVLPATRGLVRRAFAPLLPPPRTVGRPGDPGHGSWGQAPPDRSAGSDAGPVIEGEVIDPDDPTPPRG